MTAHFVIILIIAAACRIHCKADIKHLSVCLFICIWGYIVIYMWSSIWYMDRLNRFSRGERELLKKHEVCVEQEKALHYDGNRFVIYHWRGRHTTWIDVYTLKNEILSETWMYLISLQFYK